MNNATLLSAESADHAIVRRLFRASMEVQSALSIVSEERIAALLREVTGLLDESIKQVQVNALRQRHGPSTVRGVVRARTRMRMLSLARLAATR
jgi:hypothetical protein